MTTLADKLKTIPLKRTPIDVPEWADVLDGAQLYVRELSGKEFAEFADSDPTGSDTLFKLVARTLVDEAGDPVFDKPKDLEAVSGDVLRRLSDAALEVSGLTASGVELQAKN